MNALLICIFSLECADHLAFEKLKYTPKVYHTRTERHVVFCPKPLQATFGDVALFVSVHQRLLPSIRLAVTMAVR
jgi:hypothetical protein